jgi:D-alanyl-D-alanine carboxypeptidase (penicillin-binding protein 5/6)
MSGALASVLVGSGLITAPLWQSLPSPTVERLLPASYRIPGAAPTLPWPAAGQSAVAIDGVGALGSAGSRAPVPIASVAKVMTAYVVLADHPLAAGQGGPTLRITSAQAEAARQAAARGESVVKVTAGAVFTELQALQALMLPSANNMARVLAEWDGGSVAGFVARMNATAREIGLTATTYTDPSGYDPATVSTAVDQVALARKAMAVPAFAAIVGLNRVSLPVAGTVANYNTLLGQDGVVGVKTGSTDQSGGCFLFAVRIVVGGSQLLIVGAVLGQPGTGTPAQLAAVFNASRPLIRAAGAALVVHTAIHAGTVVAHVHGPLGTGTELRAAADVNVVGWAGMEVRVSSDIPPVPDRLPAGSEHGRLTATAGEAAPAGTALRSGALLTPPGTWTRLTKRP